MCHIWAVPGVHITTQPLANLAASAARRM